MAISLVENGKKKEGFIDFTPYFNKIKHKLIWCLVVVVVAAAASWILTRFISSSYTATATVLFKAQSQDVTPCRGWKTMIPPAAITMKPNTR